MMIVEQVYVTVPETLLEQNILLEVVGVHYPFGPRNQPIVGTDGVEFLVCGEFRASEEQLAKVRIELAKSDEQREAEWVAAHRKG
jgi:hypothetical protein